MRQKSVLISLTLIFIISVFIILTLPKVPVLKVPQKSAVLSGIPSPEIATNTPISKKRDVKVTKSDNTKITVRLDSMKIWPDGHITDDISKSGIAKTIFSPDESKIIVLTWDGASGVYVVLLGSTNDLVFQEIGLADISLADSVVWSTDSRYVAMVARPADTGPYRILVYNITENKFTDVNTKAENLSKDKCASVSLYNPQWMNNNMALLVTYEVYYFEGNEYCKYDSIKPIEKGQTTISLK